MSSSDHRASAEAPLLLDITSLVERAASSLTHDDPILRDAATFSLQESMSALEVTDAKMDCCELTIAGTNNDGSQSFRKTVPPRGCQLASVTRWSPPPSFGTTSLCRMHGSLHSRPLHACMPSSTEQEPPSRHIPTSTRTMMCWRTWPRN